MSTFKSAIVTVTLIFGSFCAAQSTELRLRRPEKVGMSTEKLADLSRAMQEYVDNQTVAGVSVLVARKGHVVYRENFGVSDLESGRPMQDDTIFRIASMTKFVVSVAAFTLIEDGVLCRHTPLSDFVPEFASPSVIQQTEGSVATDFTVAASSREILIENLLDHTSGLEYRFHNHPVLGQLYADNGIWDGFNTVPQGGATTLGEMVAERLAELPLLFEPGEQFTYSLSHDVLGHVIEVATGMSLADYLNQRLFIPLEMDSTFFFTNNPDQINRMATVYTPDGNGIRALGNDPVELFPNFYADNGFPFMGPQEIYSGGAGLSATLNDFYRLVQMVENGGQIRPKCGWGRVRVLNRRSVHNLLSVRDHDPRMDPFTEQFGWKGYRFNNGAGVHVDPSESGKAASIGQISWNGAFNTMFFMDPEQELIGIMMAQLVPFLGNDMQAQFERLTYEALIDPNER
ncbi:serine hydrolase domain-containing protein [Acanthopleuribacter pedis]|uniref:Beta-lactamase family protein n=1 Tax=Acanthopleuribacter pedis TaxID=442870 RepID=A0A8J7QBB0_9BACT|nr:serine hydrolase domain-containing protein [Acanthopleuribacter pedis]MBO1322396.1 beta-lactamase family protein [Acanthopleuribacter pedis]